MLSFPLFLPPSLPPFHAIIIIIIIIASSPIHELLLSYAILNLVPPLLDVSCRCRTYFEQSYLAVPRSLCKHLLFYNKHERISVSSILTQGVPPVAPRAVLRRTKKLLVYYSTLSNQPCVRHCLSYAYASPMLRPLCRPRLQARCEVGPLLLDLRPPSV